MVSRYHDSHEHRAERRSESRTRERKHRTRSVEKKSSKKSHSESHRDRHSRRDYSPEERHRSRSRHGTREHHDKSSRKEKKSKEEKKDRHDRHDRHEMREHNTRRERSAIENKSKRDRSEREDRSERRDRSVKRDRSEGRDRSERRERKETSSRSPSKHRSRSPSKHRNSRSQSPSKHRHSRSKSRPRKSRSHSRSRKYHDSYDYRDDDGAGRSSRGRKDSTRNDELSRMDEYRTKNYHVPRSRSENPRKRGSAESVSTRGGKDSARRSKVIGLVEGSGNADTSKDHDDANTEQKDSKSQGFMNFFSLAKNFVSDASPKLDQDEEPSAKEQESPELKEREKDKSGVKERRKDKPSQDKITAENATHDNELVKTSKEEKVQSSNDGKERTKLKWFARNKTVTNDEKEGVEAHQKNESNLVSPQENSGNQAKWFARNKTVTNDEKDGAEAHQKNESKPVPQQENSGNQAKWFLRNKTVANDEKDGVEAHKKNESKLVPPQENSGNQAKWFSRNKSSTNAGKERVEGRKKTETELVPTQENADNQAEQDYEVDDIEVPLEQQKGKKTSFFKKLKRPFSKKLPGKKATETSVAVEAEKTDTIENEDGDGERDREKPEERLITNEVNEKDIETKPYNSDDYVQKVVDGVGLEPEQNAQSKEDEDEQESTAPQPPMGLSGWWLNGSEFAWLASAGSVEHTNANVNVQPNDAGENNNTNSAGDVAAEDVALDETLGETLSVTAERSVENNACSLQWIGDLFNCTRNEISNSSVHEPLSGGDTSRDEHEEREERTSQAPKKNSRPDEGSVQSTESWNYFFWGPKKPDPRVIRSPSTASEYFDEEASVASSSTGGTLQEKLQTQDEEVIVPPSFPQGQEDHGVQSADTADLSGSVGTHSTRTNSLVEGQSNKCSGVLGDALFGLPCAPESRYHNEPVEFTTDEDAAAAAAAEEARARKKPDATTELLDALAREDNRVITFSNSI